MSGATDAVPAVPPPRRGPRPVRGGRLPELERLLAALSSAVSAADVGAVVTSSLTDVLGAAAVSLTSLVTPTTLELIATTTETSEPWLQGRRFPLTSDNAVARAARTLRPVVVQGRDASLEAFPDLWEGADAHGSVVTVPLLAGGECFGVLGLAFAQQHLADENIRFARIVGLGVALALSRVSARLAEQDRYAQVAFLATATAELALSLDHETTLRRLADLVVPHIANWCSIDLLDDGALRPVAVAHADPAKVDLALHMRRAYPPDTRAPTGAHVVVRTGLPEIYEDVDPALLAAAAHDQEHLRLIQELDLRSAIIVPLVAGERTLGVLTLVRTSQARRYGRNDLAFAQELARRAAVAIDHAQVHSETVEASLQLQRAVLPESFAGLTGWDVAVDYRPAGRTAVGGDFYDAVPLPDGRLVAFVGDVMGRGVAATAAMAQTRSALRAYIALDPSPGTVVERLSVMFESLDLPQLVTLVYCVIDPAAETVAVVSAGHLPPLAVRLDGTPEQLPVAPSPPLGAGHHPREAVRCPLARGETLLLFTDGLVERRGEDIDAGTERLVRCVGALGHELTDLRVKAVADTMRDMGHDDDVTIMAVRASTGSG